MAENIILIILLISKLYRDSTIDTGGIINPLVIIFVIKTVYASWLGAVLSVQLYKYVKGQHPINCLMRANEYIPVHKTNVP